VAALERLEPEIFVLDGEIAVPVGGGFSFDALLPAESLSRCFNAFILRRRVAGDQP
jgi:hypothetical protein